MKHAVALLSLLFAACTVGVNSGGNNVGDDDTMGGQDASNTQGQDGPAGNGCLDQGTAATAHTHGGGAGGVGTHAGENCMVGGCHLTGQLGANAPAFIIAGTIYKNNGVDARPGTRVKFVPDAGTQLDVTADTAGNFYVQSLPNAFPSKTDISSCPMPPIAMSTHLQAAGDGACSQAGGCHGAGGTQGPIKFTGGGGGM